MQRKPGATVWGVREGRGGTRHCSLLRCACSKAAGHHLHELQEQSPAATTAALPDSRSGHKPPQLPSQAPGVVASHHSCLPRLQEQLQAASAPTVCSRGARDPTAAENSGTGQQLLRLHTPSIKGIMSSTR